MPTFAASPDLQLHYLVDDFTDPWTTPETIVLLHGNCESSLAWYAWVPLLARWFRVVRPDMRGYGASTPMPRDFKRSLDVIIDDYARLMDSLGVARFHLVGAKIGGIIARAFAARRSERVTTLTVIGSPPPLRKGAENIPALTEEFETLGVEHWARRTMGGRLGAAFPADGVEWWIEFMGRAPVSTLVGFNAAINYSDIRADLPKIACPTLVITTTESGLASVDETRAWQQTIPHSELLVIPNNSFHVAATDAERCAQATLEFIGRSSSRRAP
jgi:pimeloyl-ACP methyl ester carboxylesterase